ncbi:sugar phosphate isomerase/epimerase family protein [Paenibacillus sp. 1001270B_150601_E10]|uniref:sugar phosphate isomerase/epimerase family protein n=1 Tax=Paenibacillus sp. 1001270B_150601_E10 TaxID=2787079 RepID=UPI00189DDED8|nr:sugar phosphate isomerase/epimerase [Paenibacillus sp. 1001270B_150601_E10]
MKFAICTISFRHQLISFTELMRFAKEHAYQGIELWGVHADQLYEQYLSGSSKDPSLHRSLAQEGLEISMLSDYLDISSHEAFPAALRRCDHLIQIAQWLEVDRIRTFAGRKGSLALTPMERASCVRRLQQLCERCRRSGIKVVLEIHPGTLTDSLESTTALLAETGYDNVRLNFDVLHAWEYGRDVRDTLQRLKPWVDYFHLKNVALPHQVHIFEPSNIYSASGTREGMVLLREGVVDYSTILDYAKQLDCYASVEWFGPSPLSVLREESCWLQSFAGKGVPQAQVVQV